MIGARCDLDGKTVKRHGRGRQTGPVLGSGDRSGGGSHRAKIVSAEQGGEMQSVRSRLLNDVAERMGAHRAVDRIVHRPLRRTGQGRQGSVNCWRRRVGLHCCQCPVRRWRTRRVGRILGGFGLRSWLWRGRSRQRNPCIEICGCGCAIRTGC